MTGRLSAAYRRAVGRAYGWATLRLYDELAWAYDPISWFVSGGRWDAWRRFALDNVQGPAVLELGFGTGELLIEMHAAGLAAVGLDASRPMHRVLARKVQRRGLADRAGMPPRVLGRGQALPFAAGAFNTVVATFPAGYILEVATLREVARVLASDGRLVIVGLIVQIPRSARYPLSIAPDGPWSQLWEHFEAVAGQAGLVGTVTWRADGRARVPVIVCTRLR